MASVIIPVLLCFFLGPGVGQLYNKEYKKGWILILLNAVIGIVGLSNFFALVRASLPSDLSSVDPDAVQTLMTNAIHEAVAKGGAMTSFFLAILAVSWIYGVVDAYQGAVKKSQIG